MKDREENKLKLRKKKINNIFNTKRKIYLNDNEKEDETKKYYYIFLEDLELNQSNIINKEKLFSNVNIII